MKRILYIVLFFVLIVFIGVAVLWLSTTSRINSFENLDYDIDLSRVPDGTYLGEAQTSLIKAEVEVRISGAKLEAVHLLRHDSGKGEPAEVITEHMVEKNRIDVDSISGASASSVVIKAAVLDALESAVRP